MSYAGSKLTKAGISVINGKIRPSDVATAVKVLTANEENQPGKGNTYLVGQIDSGKHTDKFLADGVSLTTDVRYAKKFKDEEEGAKWLAKYGHVYTGASFDMTEDDLSKIEFIDIGSI
jgi:3-mercaptopyruvate sulfurtransferase SseA